jgi:hydrogenase expression/formation protein HypD
VTPLEIIDKAIALARRKDVILVSYGDMMRVPGSETDLLRVKAQGGDVRMVYSPLECLKIAQENPRKEVVFFGVGFETTAPPNAMAVWQARRQGVKNFSLLASHVLVPPALRAIFDAPGNRVQGLIAPGHVCTITGLGDYRDFSRQYNVPVVAGGFEPVDLLEAIVMLTAQLEEGRAEVENQYSRSIRAEGNAHAQKITAEVLEVCDRKWRGLGLLPKSGLGIRAEWSGFDAEKKFDLGAITAEEPAECMSAMVLRGRIKPPGCPAFAVRCTPENPLGAPMVSSEGPCAAYYRYRRSEPRETIAIGGAA